MKLPIPAALAAALCLGSLPVLAQDAPAPAPAPVAQPRAAASADAQAAPPPVVAHPAGSRGDCPWKAKGLTS